MPNNLTEQSQKPKASKATKTISNIHCWLGDYIFSYICSLINVRVERLKNPVASDCFPIFTVFDCGSILVQFKEGKAIVYGISKPVCGIFQESE